MPVGLKAGPMSQYLQYLKGALLSLTMNSCLAPVSTHHITHQCLTSTTASRTSKFTSTIFALKMSDIYCWICWPILNPNPLYVLVPTLNLFSSVSDQRCCTLPLLWVEPSVSLTPQGLPRNIPKLSWQRCQSNYVVPPNGQHCFQVTSIDWYAEFLDETAPTFSWVGTVVHDVVPWLYHVISTEMATRCNVAPSSNQYLLCEYFILQRYPKEEFYL